MLIPSISSVRRLRESVNSVTGEKTWLGHDGYEAPGGLRRVCVQRQHNTQLAEKNGFTEEDAEKIKQALITLFENDSSSARPDGSMEVHKVYWWKHNSKLGQYSSAKVHRCLKVESTKDEPKSFEDYSVELHGLTACTLK